MALTCSFAGKRILVTGGANGLGRAIVQKLAKDNALVTTIDRNEEALKVLKNDFPNVTTIAADLGHWDATKKIVSALPPQDHLVNNAGVICMVPFLAIEEQHFDTIFNVNLKSVINVSQAVVSNMIQNNIQGSIVNVASLSAQLAAKGLSLYGGSKAALSNVTKSMALELGKHGIRVNAICPGIIETDMLRSSAEGADLMTNAMLKRTCFRRTLQPEEPADLTLFLLSPQASMITGQSVYIDAGFTTN